MKSLLLKHTHLILDLLLYRLCYIEFMFYRSFLKLHVRFVSLIPRLHNFENLVCSFMSELRYSLSTFFFFLIFNIILNCLISHILWPPKDISKPYRDILSSTSCPTSHMFHGILCFDLLSSMSILKGFCMSWMYENKLICSDDVCWAFPSSIGFIISYENLSGVVFNALHLIQVFTPLLSQSC